MNGRVRGNDAPWSVGIWASCDPGSGGSVEKNKRSRGGPHREREHSIGRPWDCQTLLPPRGPSTERRARDFGSPWSGPGTATRAGSSRRPLAPPSISWRSPRAPWMSAGRPSSRKQKKGMTARAVSVLTASARLEDRRIEMKRSSKGVGAQKPPCRPGGTRGGSARRTGEGRISSCPCSQGSLGRSRCDLKGQF